MCVCFMVRSVCMCVCFMMNHVCVCVYVFLSITFQHILFYNTFFTLCCRCGLAMEDLRSLSQYLNTQLLPTWKDSTLTSSTSYPARFVLGDGVYVCMCVCVCVVLVTPNKHTNSVFLCFFCVFFLYGNTEL